MEVGMDDGWMDEKWMNGWMCGKVQRIWANSNPQTLELRPCIYGVEHGVVDWSNLVT